jgi:peptidoglycan/LPS O-acetylase OafA/YrhL
VTHIPRLDGLRAASILLVLWAHTVPVGPDIFFISQMAGVMGMSLFFCLSGYLITSTLLGRPAALPFLVKRTFRIVPSLWLYLLILVVFLDVSPQGALLNALFLQNYLPPNLVDVGPVGHLWSLAVEMQFYLAIGIVVWLAGVRGLWIIPIAAMVVTGLRIDQEIYRSAATHLRVDEILSGGCLALLLHHWPPDRRVWLSGPVKGSLLLGLAFVLWALSSHSMGGPLNYLRPYLTAAVVGLVLVSAPAALHNVLSSRPAAYIARISYALYIYHVLMVWGWMSEGSAVERNLVKLPASWALMWAAAHLSTFYWEAYWLRFAKERLLGERRQAQDRAAKA